MINNDFNRFGDDIRRTIQDAIERGDFSRLNQTITNTVNQATDWVNRNIGNMGAQYAQNKTYTAPNYSPVGDLKKKKAKKQNPALYAEKPASVVISIGLLVLGVGFSAGLSIFTLLAFIGAMKMGDVIQGYAFLAIMIFPIFLAFRALVEGIQTLGRIKRFKIYKNTLGAAEFCKIEELAEAVQKKTKFVLRDLKFMIKKEWFREGHLDKQKTCLIVSNNMYQRYELLESRYEAQQKMKLEKEQQRQGLSEDVQSIIAQGEEYVKKIRACNDAIPGEEVSAKISHMEMVVDKIFNRVEKDPSLVDDLGKLMDYYLPTTIKLLEVYEQMDKQPVGGENIQSAKKEIEATLDTLNEAFEKILDSLFQAAAWDVSSDISVLNTMLAKEGLKGDGLKK